MRVSTSVRRRPLLVRGAAAGLLTLLVGSALHALRAAPSAQTAALDGLRGAMSYLDQAAAPYLLVPFAVGLIARTRLGALAGGVVACWFLVASYYGWFLPGSMDSQRGGGAEQVFWLVAAVGAGTFGGLLGRASQRRGRVRFVMPAVLVLEPFVWLLLLRMRVAPVLAQPQDVAGAAVEAALGVLWIALLMRRRSADRSVADPRRAVTPAG